MTFATTCTIVQAIHDVTDYLLVLHKCYLNTLEVKQTFHHIADFSLTYILLTFGVHSFLPFYQNTVSAPQVWWSHQRLTMQVKTIDNKMYSLTVGMISTSFNVLIPLVGHLAAKIPLHQPPIISMTTQQMGLISGENIQHAVSWKPR